MNTNKVLTMLFAVTLTAAGGVQAAGDADAGKEKSATCLACHGENGNSVNPIWPKLAGQHPGYLRKQLMNFKAGDRSDPLMSAQAAPLSEQDMEDLAAYYSEQATQSGAAAEDQVALGERLYRGGNLAAGVAACASCHGPSGLGNPAANFPALSGQHADYTVKTLKDFRAGARANDMNRMMRDVASRMTEAEIMAVAQYIQGLHR